MKELVFVYGTLKKGFGNHRVMEQAGGKLIKPYTTEPRFKMVSLGGFPGVIVGGNTGIVGEVYEVDYLDPLDALEGYPSFYDRIKVSVDEEQSAWMYILDEESFYIDYPEVKDGTWKR